VTNGIDILLALAALIAAFEVVLFVFRGILLRANQTERLERQAREAQDELRQVQERSKERQAELAAARDEAETALAALRQASRELADAQRPREVLVHRLGDPVDGTLFRAALRKTLPDTPEENQTLFWSYENFVDVWASNARRAHDIAARHFAAKAGYVLGQFEELTGAGANAQSRSQDAHAEARSPEVAA
jgi:hypothetical protein